MMGISSPLQFKSSDKVKYFAFSKSEISIIFDGTPEFLKSEVSVDSSSLTLNFSISSDITIFLALGLTLYCV